VLVEDLWDTVPVADVYSYIVLALGSGRSARAPREEMALEQGARDILYI
jgi:hypothetical protein